MCGIFGYAGPFNYRVASLLQALTVEDQVRGKHSTGLAIAARQSGSRKLKPFVAKKALTGSDFVRAGHSGILFREKYPLAIGHNRFATAGEINDRNAHPFCLPRPHGVALAVHNGIVGGKDALARRFGVKDRPVDSEVLFRAIAKRAGRGEEGLLDAIEEVMRFIAPRADFACLWMEPSWRSLYLFRSSQRPLSIFDARRLGLGRFFASTVEIFANAWGSVRGCLSSIKKVKTFEARPLSIYRVVDDGKWEVERLRTVKAPSKPKPKPAAAVHASSYQQDSLFETTPRSDFLEPYEDRQVFVCTHCRLNVIADHAVFADPSTGLPATFGSPYHEKCLADDNLTATPSRVA